MYITPLRQRMMEDMSLRNFGEKTQKDYIRAVTNLTIFLQRSPDTVSNEDLRLFRLHLTANRVGASTINGTATALRFFFTVTLDLADVIKHLTFVPEPRKMPVILSSAPRRPRQQWSRVTSPSATARRSTSSTSSEVVITKQCRIPGGAAPAGRHPTCVKARGRVIFLKVPTAAERRALNSLDSPKLFDPF